MAENKVEDARRSGKPYIWVSWVTKLISGEDLCWWKAWYKAHFKASKRPETQERKEFLEGWTKKHDAMVEARAKRFREQGWLARVEDDTKFTFEGNAATLAGKADVVGLDPNSVDALVVDQKSGKRRKSDQWQVRIYMWALPATWLPGRALRGAVEYVDGDKAVTLKPEDIETIAAAVRKIAANEAPPRVPSPGECAFCDVAACPDRIEAATGRTDSF